MRKYERNSLYLKAIGEHKKKKKIGEKLMSQSIVTLLQLIGWPKKSQLEKLKRKENVH